VRVDDWCKKNMKYEMPEARSQKRESFGDVIIK
jgi:hypothetical protein